MTRAILYLAFGPLVCLGVLVGLLIEPSPAEPAKSDVKLDLPEPPPRFADAAERSETCLECHDDMQELFEGDKHIADDFHCVVCHGKSTAHLEMEVEGALPDRTWRRWLEDEQCFEWRIEDASLEIARLCASCHGRKPADDPSMKTIDWKKYLGTGHGRGVHKGRKDAPTCTDCHYAHGAGCEPFTDQTVIDRCASCHDDQEMMVRAGLDPDVVQDFEAGVHENMADVSAEEKSSCANCHPPH